MYYAELNVPKNHVYLFKPQTLCRTWLFVSVAALNGEIVVY